MTYLRSDMKSVSDPAYLQGIKQHLRDQFRWEGRTVSEIRQAEEAAIAALPALEGAEAERAEGSPVPAEWVTSHGIKAEDAPVVLYLHGGGFIAGSCATHRDLAARLSRASGARVLVPAYRLAPEHLYPAAGEDAMAAYRWLLGSGIPAASVVIGGDSAGGTLALMTLLALRDAGEPLPAGALLLSPHTDFVRYDSPTYVNRADRDPTGSLDSSKRCAQAYTGGVGLVPPALSPLSQDLRRLPPLLIQVGGEEVLLGECEAFAQQAAKAGTEAALEVWEGMWCVFQQLAAMVPEGALAIERAGTFIQERTAGRPKRG
ncbi:MULTISPECIES: alpha/beta hydrolase [Paenibacillus]|uniref:alpha/beta hydrolase n=1 Tax=Paenibacillus TaxID=44249 RepID=UPI0022B935B6|nr:alpha/beta hydrolase [Paenibacillus caseinilyticus]MCZ8518628.1 alpha/beta hydrolase [Paenibacillus caseinilyticus]